MSESEFELVEGSGNVFRDFAEPDADLKQAKAIVAARIIAVLDERALTVRKAEEATGFAAADFSHIRNASLGRFTLDRLMKILAVPQIRAERRSSLPKIDSAVATQMKGEVEALWCAMNASIVLTSWATLSNEPRLILHGVTEIVMEVLEEQIGHGTRLAQSPNRRPTPT